MDLLDEEVFGVITALIVIGSVFSAALVLRPSNPEPFTAIGLLNENCKIGDYPDFVLTGENRTLCIFISNHMREPEAFMVIYKFGTPADKLPTNTTPSPVKPVQTFYAILNSGQETIMKTQIHIPARPDLIGRNATLIFELWQYSTQENKWIYTGKWVHLHVRVEGIPQT